MADQGPIGRFFEGFIRRRAIRRYLTLLPKRLLADYGHPGPYTPAQVTSSIQRSRTSSPYNTYALAVFCTPEALKHAPEQDKPPAFYEGLRLEVATAWFGGDVHFTSADVHHHAAHHHASGGDHGHGDMGGHHGGIAGGHH